MTPKQAMPYHRQLLELRSALLEQMGTQEREDAAPAHFERGEDSSAQVATEREFESAIGERENAELSMIDAALARIEAGTYGECINCGKDIPAPRLKASPESPRCIPCQQKAEQHVSA